MAEKLSSARPAAASTMTPQKPEAPVPPSPAKNDEEELSPTRFGDWEKNGRCIDF